MEPVDVELPGGIRLDGSWRRDARLRPLAGRDEAFVLQQRGALLPAALTTAVLARCLCRLGPVSPVTPDIVRRLSVGCCCICAGWRSAKGCPVFSNVPPAARSSISISP